MNESQTFPGRHDERNAFPPGIFYIKSNSGESGAGRADRYGIIVQITWLAICSGILAKKYLSSVGWDDSTQDLCLEDGVRLWKRIPISSNTPSHRGYLLQRARLAVPSSTGLTPGSSLKRGTWCSCVSLWKTSVQQK